MSETRDEVLEVLKEFGGYEDLQPYALAAAVLHLRRTRYLPPEVWVIRDKLQTFYGHTVRPDEAVGELIGEVKRLRMENMTLWRTIKELVPPPPTTTVADDDLHLDDSWTTRT